MLCCAVLCSWNTFHISSFSVGPPFTCGLKIITPIHSIRGRVTIPNKGGQETDTKDHLVSLNRLKIPATASTHFKRNQPASSVISILIQSSINQSSLSSSWVGGAKPKKQRKTTDHHSRIGLVTNSTKHFQRTGTPF